MAHAVQALALAVLMAPTILQSLMLAQKIIYNNRSAIASTCFGSHVCLRRLSEPDLCLLLLVPLRLGGVESFAAPELQLDEVVWSQSGPGLRLCVVQHAVRLRRAC